VCQFLADYEEEEKVEVEVEVKVDQQILSLIKLIYNQSLLFLQQRG